MMWNPALLDIYRKDTKGCKTLVVQNLSENVQEENLQNYLEIICADKELTDVCVPLQGYGVALAIFKTNLNDIKRCQGKASARPFEETVLNLELLHEPDGIFVPNVPSSTNEEYLSLYFESKRSGGEEDTVQNVQIISVNASTHAIVDISSTHAINTILSKEIHQLRNTDVKVLPYYTTVQGYIVASMKQRKIQSGTRVHQACNPDVREKNTVRYKHTSQPITSSQQHDLRITEANSSMCVGEKILTEKTQIPQRSFSSDLVNNGHHAINESIKPSYGAECTNNRQETSNTGFRLKIISDDSEVQSSFVLSRPIVPNTLNQNVSTEIKKENVHFSQDEQCEKCYINDRPVNIAAVKPVVRSYARQSSDERNENNRKARGARGRRTRVSNTNESGMLLDCHEEIQLSSAKINMLIIFKFQAKSKTENLEVEFKESEGRVIFKGHSEDDVRRAKLKMHECLDQLVHVKETFPRLKCEFLAREECRRCIRSRCIKQKIKAAFSIDVTKSVVWSYGFSNDEAEKGIQFIKDEITVSKVNLRPGQEQFVFGDGWNKMIRDLDTGLTTIYVDDVAKNIIIESFLDMKAKDICKKIIKYLKQNVPLKTSEVILESAKARCFKSCFEDKLRRIVEKSRGKLNVDTQSDNPLRIRVCVEGEETLTEEMTKLVEQIWHEKIDFDKISETDDRWLIMKGLDGPFGKDFFSKFEMSHNCFIQVSTAGIIKLNRPSMSSEDTDRIIDSDVDTPSENYKHESDWDVATTRAFDEDDDIPKMEHQLLYQHGLGDDEAFEMARALSMNDENRFFATENVDDAEEDILRSPLQPRHNQNHRRPTGRGGRHYSNRLHESTSSPDLPRHLPASPIPQVKSESIRMMQTSVILLKGEIVRQSADVLVNIVSPSHSLTESIVSRAFIKRAGQELIQLYDTARLNSVDGVVSTCSCGKLRCKSVMHVVLQKGEIHCQQVVQRTIKQVLQACQTGSYKSVMFPPLGVGRLYKYPSETVADSMLSGLYQTLQNNLSRPNQVTIVVYDDPTYAVFEKAFKSFDSSTSGRNMAVQARPYFTQDPFGTNARNNLLQQQRQQQLRQLSAQLPFNALVTPRPHKQGLVVPRSRNHQSEYKSPDSNKYSPRGRVRRQYNVEQGRDKEHGQTQKRKEKRRPHIRFSERKPAPNLCVVVVATDKHTCIQARNNLGKKIKDEFLYEECIEKREKISDEAKRKIVSIIEKRNIKSIKGRQKYTLKGHKESVSRARTDILEVLLSEMDMSEKKRKRKEGTRRETQEFVRLMVEEEPEVPSYWSKYKSNATLKSILTTLKLAVTGKNYEKVTLQSNSQEFNTIVSMISSTFDSNNLGKGQDAQGLGGYSQLHVLKIQRIENLELYDKFTSTRQKIFMKLLKARVVRFPQVKDLPNCTGPIQTCRFLNSSLDKDIHSEINEVLLFHGTKRDNVETICSSGFDHRLGSGRAMFGAGIYGAEHSTKADQYADDKTSRTIGQGHHKKMFLMRMILGNSYICTDQNPHKYRRPPCTSCYQDNCKEGKHAENKYGHMFDSVIGDNGKLFREFVVYDSSLCYPEYIITYERQ